MNTLVCLLVVVAVSSVWNMDIIPERGNVTYINEKYISDAKLYIRRYSRRGLYYINVEGRPLQPWGNNVSIHFYFYEFLHNEYKRSFVELHFKEFCKWINQESYIGVAFRDVICSDAKRRQDDVCGASGIKCPLPAGFYRMHNVTISATNFPNVWPFERSRVDVSGRAMPSDEMIFEVQVYVLFKQKLGK